MIPIQWQEWYLDVLAGVQMLRHQCDKVFALGLSMGGALSLILASREPVDGVVAMSTPHEIENRGTRFLPLVHPFYPMFGKRSVREEESPFNQRVVAEQTARGEQPIGHIAYPVYPTRSVIELGKVLAEMRASLPRITAPILFMHSKMDDVVTFESLEKNPPLATSCRDKQVIVLEQSLHVITEDCEREKVFQAAANFIASHC
jgi:carboxylesterase